MSEPYVGYALISGDFTLENLQRAVRKLLDRLGEDRQRLDLPLMFVKRGGEFGLAAVKGDGGVHDSVRQELIDRGWYYIS